MITKSAKEEEEAATQHANHHLAKDSQKMHAVAVASGAMPRAEVAALHPKHRQQLQQQQPASSDEEEVDDDTFYIPHEDDEEENENWVVGSSASSPKELLLMNENDDHDSHNTDEAVLLSSPSSVVRLFDAERMSSSSDASKLVQPVSDEVISVEDTEKTRRCSSNNNKSETEQQAAAMECVAALDAILGGHSAATRSAATCRVIRSARSSSSSSSSSQQQQAATEARRPRSCSVGSMPATTTSPPNRSRTKRQIFPRKPSLKRVSSYAGDSIIRSTSSSQKHSVSFSQLHVREFDIALSDHPSCSYGPPIQLGWKYQDRPSRALSERLQEEERRRSPSSSPRLLSYHARSYLLLHQKRYSQQDLHAAMSEVDRVKRNRLLTDLFWPLEEKWDQMASHVQGWFQKPHPSTQEDDGSNTAYCRHDPSS